MKAKQCLLLILLIVTNLLYAQKEVLESYPPQQNFYVGGLTGLNKEMVKIVKEQNLLPCDGEEERYVITILVNEDKSINYVKDADSVEIQKNKCAFDYGRKIFPFLKSWIPAREDGKLVSAITKIMIEPFFLYHSKEDLSKNEFKKVEYKGGINSFRNKVKNIFEDRIKKNENKWTGLTFSINKKGEIEDVELMGAFSDIEKKKIIYDIISIKGTWKPATFNGVPFKSKSSMSLVQNFDLGFEHEKNRILMNPNKFH